MSAALQCDRLAELMRGAMDDMPPALDVAALPAAYPARVRATGPFALRFIKLQGTLGGHVLRLFATRVMAAPVVFDLPLMEMLPRLERFGLRSAPARRGAMRGTVPTSCHPPM